MTLFLSSGLLNSAWQKHPVFAFHFGCWQTHPLQTKSSLLFPWSAEGSANGVFHHACHLFLNPRQAEQLPILFQASSGRRFMPCVLSTCGRLHCHQNAMAQLLSSSAESTLIMYPHVTSKAVETVLSVFCKPPNCLSVDL